MSDRKLRIGFLVGLTAAALYFCYLITAPFLKPILAAAVIAIVCFPLHKHVKRYLHHPNAAALVSLLLIVLLVIIPVVLLSQVLHREGKTTYQMLVQQMEQSGSWTLYVSQLLDRSTRWLQRFVDLAQFDLRSAIVTRLEQFGSLLLTRIASAFSNLTNFIVQTVITFFALFFFLRDGHKLWRWMSALSPLRPEQMQKLSDSVNATILASMYGVLAVALAQGALLSLAFYALGLPAPLLWGAVTAMFSLVPLVGSAAIWLPAAIILILSGDWMKGLLLLGWGAGVVAMADNVIRPLVLSESARMHGLQTFIALLGGLQAFGLLGLFIGPVVLAVTKALLQILHEETRAGKNIALLPDNDYSLPVLSEDVSILEKHKNNVRPDAG